MVEYLPTMFGPRLNLSTVKQKKKKKERKEGRKQESGEGGKRKDVRKKRKKIAITAMDKRLSLDKKCLKQQGGYFDRI